LPLSTLSKYDPYLAQNKISRPGAKKPQPNLPPSSYTPPVGRSSPTEMGAAPAMPVPEPYLPSNSEPALPFINLSTKPTRRRSNPSPQPAAAPSPRGKHCPMKQIKNSIVLASPAPERSTTARRRSTATDTPEAQCAGTTKAGKRCTRVVKDPPPAAMYVNPLDPDGAIERYCFQHRAEMAAQTVVPSRKTGTGIITFSHWISDDLQEDTKVLLKATMEQPVTAADTEGQIYCFQILSEPS